MSTSFSGTASFVRGCLGRQGRLLLQLSDNALAKQKVLHSFFLIWENGLLSQPIRSNWHATAIVYVDWPEAEFIGLGEDGEILAIKPDASTTESAIFHDRGLTQLGPLRGAASIGRHVYIVGSGHQAYRLGPALDVTNISIPLELVGDGMGSVGLEAVHGFDESEIYAVGWDGEMWLYDGLTWRQLGGPTNLILAAVLCAPDGVVYAVGQEGAVVRGRQNQWEVVESPVRENLWSVAWFFERLHAASYHQLFTLDGDLFRSVEIPGDPQSFFWLDSIPNAMLSVGPDDVVLLLPDRAVKVV